MIGRVHNLVESSFVLYDTNLPNDSHDVRSRQVLRECLYIAEASNGNMKQDSFSSERQLSSARQ